MQAGRERSFRPAVKVVSVDSLIEHLGRTFAFREDIYTMCVESHKVFGLVTLQAIEVNQLTAVL